MVSKRALERTLASLEGFEEPRVDLEQYPTPAGIAAHIIHLADLQGDLDGIVIDLGTGTGLLALGAALLGSDRVIGLDRDPSALATAVENERDLDAPVPVQWLLADATRIPLCLHDATVVMNPPFGAQKPNRHADRSFLESASMVARVSYSLHNEGSRAFVDSIAADHGGTVTHAFAADLDIARQFEFHGDDRATIPAEAFRIAWD